MKSTKTQIRMHSLAKCERSTSLRRCIRIGAISTIIAQGLATTPAIAEPAAAGNDGVKRCDELRSIDFSTLLDAPTQIIATNVVAPKEDIPRYCEVSAYVVPNIAFLLRLPINSWNGKFFEVGCGGSCGTFAWVGQCDNPLRRGYACAASDGGHRSTPLDLKWAYNDPQAPIDYLLRAPHVTALAGKAIAQHYYQQAPRKSYFFGCSGGGTQAMFSAQRFPWDFDGIVALSPAISHTEVRLNLLWGNRAFTDKNGNALLSPEDLALVHAAVVAKCDLNDGLKDRLIGDPRKCDFEPERLRCASGKQRECLTAVQIDAVKKLYNGPTNTKGDLLAMPTVLKGSERTWPTWYGTFAPGSPQLSHRAYAADWFRYVYFQPNPGPTWQPDDLDFERDHKRLGMAEALDPNNADLRRFKAAGGKLIMVNGWEDAIIGVPRNLDYYENVEKIIGGRPQTQSFFRSFVLPGVEHCTGGEGAFAVDYVAYIERWVESGHAPDYLLASRVSADHPMDFGGHAKFPLNQAKVEFSRPVYPYPVRTRYLGRGDPKSAASFGPEQP